MASNTEGLVVGDVVKSEAPQWASRKRMTVDESQTLTIGEVCRPNTSGRMAAVAVGVDAVQKVSMAGGAAGTFRLGFFTDAEKWIYTDEIAYNANLAACQTGIDTAVGASQVTASGTVPALILTFDGTNYAAKKQPLVKVTAADADFTLITIETTTHGGSWGGGPIDEVQTATVTGTETAGSYTLTMFDKIGVAVTTAAIQYDDNLAAVQAAIDLVALPTGSITAGGTIVSDTFTLTYDGPGYEGREFPMATADVTLLTGVTAWTFAETTKGSSEVAQGDLAVCIEAVTTAASALTTKGNFIVRDAIVDTDRLTLNSANKTAILEQLEIQGVLARSEAETRDIQTT